jgi:hypothetical protein
MESFDGKSIKKILISKNKSQDDYYYFNLTDNRNIKTKIALNKIGSFHDCDIYMIYCNIPVSSWRISFDFAYNKHDDSDQGRLMKLFDITGGSILYDSDGNYNHVFDVYRSFMPKDTYIPKILMLIDQINILEEIKNLLKIKLIFLFIDYEKLIPKNNEISFSVYPCGTGNKTAISLFISEE